MTCTTFLHESELNIPLPDKECQSILDEARRLTGRNWQVVPWKFSKRKWFKTEEVTLYGVYVYVGGVGPWQQINFFHSEDGTNFYVSLDIVAAYFLGMISTTQRTIE